MSFLGRDRPPQRPQPPKAKPVRYWPGKAPAPEAVQSDSDDENEEQDKQQSLEDRTSRTKNAALIDQVAVTSIGSDELVDRRLRRLQASKAQQENEEVDEDEEEEEIEQHKEEEKEEDEEAASSRRLQAREIALARRRKEEEEAERAQQQADEEEESGDDSSEYTDEESEEEEVAPKPLFKPVFVPKTSRVTVTDADKLLEEEEEADRKRDQEREDRRREAHNMVAEELKREIAEAASSIKTLITDIDDTDGLDEEAEFESWKLRELLRIKRDRTEASERELDETEKERRRNMTDAEIMAENSALNPDSQGKSKQRFMQKYFHKGVFYLDEHKDVLEKRDFAEPTLDDRFDKSILPEVMQVKNFGRAGRTKWKHLAAEDTTQYDAGWAQKDNPVNKRGVEKMGGLHQTGFDRPNKKSRGE
ncbi:hypothetical protein SmJEL517_g00115 [Synchytrium microbalum]|uniref:Micro-fibrillar-associated protein 1 C-terminal domain-containing protein n=1 Tax=Synchytrium microbalum TaxID=1806994 RepID=A0A507CG37_9FUNG|nr:uncharacterized protein SmJEL517_g00115 [Synchytrium microbalum]TPX38328.1 hypothetical protein SmJEL517_g00115 [Synchytrium microbalum]